MRFDPGSSRIINGDSQAWIRADDAGQLPQPPESDEEVIKHHHSSHPSTTMFSQSLRAAVSYNWVLPMQLTMLIRHSQRPLVARMARPTMAARRSIMTPTAVRSGKNLHGNYGYVAINH